MFAIQECGNRNEQSRDHYSCQGRFVPVLLQNEIDSVREKPGLFGSTVADYTRPAPATYYINDRTCGQEYEPVAI